MLEDEEELVVRVIAGVIRSVGGWLGRGPVDTSLSEEPPQASPSSTTSRPLTWCLGYTMNK